MSCSLLVLEESQRDLPFSTKNFAPEIWWKKAVSTRVLHESHWLMHEATLLAGERFPICKECKHKVRFELRRAVKNPTRITSGYHAILEDYPDAEPSPIV